VDEATAPLFRQIATFVEDSIVDGTLSPGDRAPSTNELAAFHHINPATARKGMTLLVDNGVLGTGRPAVREKLGLPPLSVNGSEQLKAILAEPEAER